MYLNNFLKVFQAFKIFFKTKFSKESRVEKIIIIKWIKCSYPKTRLRINHGHSHFNRCD